MGGRAAEASGAGEARTSVVVEVDGKRVEVSPADTLLAGAGSAADGTRGPAPRRRAGGTRSTPPPATR